MSALEIDVRHESWPIAGDFTISRGSKTSADVIVVTLSRNGSHGRGEAVPYARYGETVEMCIAAISSSASALRLLSSREQIPGMAIPVAARNALDCAFWDLECKERDEPAWLVAGLPMPAILTTAYTISLDTPEAMARDAAASADCALLKLKLGRAGDVDRLEAVRRAAPSARLIVDANEGWVPEDVERMLALCACHKVELVEQPLPATNDNALFGLKRPLPVCADESAHGIESLAGLRGKYDAINIKLDKTGGLTPALALAKTAQDQGFQIMVGCMLATSLSMAPAHLLGHFAQWVDLDGPLLLARDRDPGVKYIGGTMLPPPRALWG